MTEFLAGWFSRERKPGERECYVVKNINNVEGMETSIKDYLVDNKGYTFTGKKGALNFKNGSDTDLSVCVIPYWHGSTLNADVYLEAIKTRVS